MVVLSVYKQIRAQTSPVLSDIDEDNFDRAFEILRPVIQGSADIAKSVTHEEVAMTMSFVENLFAPTDPEMYKSVKSRVAPELYSPEGPILTPDAVDKAVGEADDEARYVLKEINARKPIHTMYNSMQNFQTESITGWKVKCETGSLGLVRA